MTSSAHRGRKLILAILAIYFLFEILVILFTFAVRGFRLEISAFIRLGLAIVLAYFLYRGRNWARLVWSVLFGLGGLFGLVLCFFLIRANPQPVIVIFFLVGIIFFWISAGLLFRSPHIRAYVNERDAGSSSTDSKQ